MYFSSFPLVPPNIPFHLLRNETSFLTPGSFLFFSPFRILFRRGDHTTVFFFSPLNALYENQKSSPPLFSPSLNYLSKNPSQLAPPLFPPADSPCPASFPSPFLFFLILLSHPPFPLQSQRLKKRTGCLSGSSSSPLPLDKHKPVSCFHFALPPFPSFPRSSYFHSFLWRAEREQYFVSSFSFFNRRGTPFSFFFSISLCTTFSLYSKMRRARVLPSFLAAVFLSFLRFPPFLIPFFQVFSIEGGVLLFLRCKEAVTSFPPCNSQEFAFLPPGPFFRHQRRHVAPFLSF